MDYDIDKMIDQQAAKVAKAREALRQAEVAYDEALMDFDDLRALRLEVAA